MSINNAICMFCNDSVPNALRMSCFSHHEILFGWYLGNEKPFYRPRVRTKPELTHIFTLVEVYTFMYKCNSGKENFKTICRHRKLPVATLKEQCPWQIKMQKFLIYGCWFWQRVTRGGRKIGPVHWAKVGWCFIEMQKWLLAEQSWCCFKMHQNCMQQRNQQIGGYGKSYSFALGPQSALSCIGTNTSTG